MERSTGTGTGIGRQAAAAAAPRVPMGQRRDRLRASVANGKEDRGKDPVSLMVTETAPAADAPAMRQGRVRVRVSTAVSGRAVTAANGDAEGGLRSSVSGHP